MGDNLSYVKLNPSFKVLYNFWFQSSYNDWNGEWWVIICHAKLNPCFESLSFIIYSANVHTMGGKFWLDFGSYFYLGFGKVVHPIKVLTLIKYNSSYIMRRPAFHDTHLSKPILLVGDSLYYANQNPSFESLF